jgi:hypothetical protein
LGLSISVLGFVWDFVLGISYLKRSYVVAGFIPASGDGDGLGGHETRAYDGETLLHQLNEVIF